ncbi:unnamed protein product, partial [Ectocarpus sp. 12 AP-2014]
MPRGDNRGSKVSGSMPSAGLDAKVGGVTVTVKRAESDVSDGEEEDNSTPQGTEDGADNEVSEVGFTDQEKQGRGEVVAGEVDILMKEEEEEEEHKEKAWPGKRKFGGISKAVRRYSVRSANSRQPNHAESPKAAPSKLQRKAAALGTKEQHGDGVTAATRTTPSRITGRSHG